MHFVNAPVLVWTYLAKLRWSSSLHLRCDQKNVSLLAVSWLNLKRFMNLKVFIIVKHVKWCIPTRAVFQKIYFSRLKRVISTICIVYHFFLKHLGGPESDWLIPCPPAVLIFPSRPRRILHLSIDLRERLNDVNIVTSDSHLWIQTAKAIKRQRILSSRKEKPTSRQRKLSWNTNCRRNVKHISGPFGKHFVKFQEKTVFHQPRSVIIGKNCTVCLEYHPRAQFFFQYGPSGWWITFICLSDVC